VVGHAAVVLGRESGRAMRDEEEMGGRERERVVAEPGWV
jgi:hypothetical protein